MTPAEIAARLTEAQKRALEDISPPGIRSLRPGHNLLGDVEFAATPDGPFRFDALDLETLHRLGVAEAIDAEEELEVFGGPHLYAGTLIATHRYTLTALGQAVRAIIEKEPALAVAGEVQQRRGGALAQKEDGK
jgi:hypothetical protein